MFAICRAWGQDVLDLEHFGIIDDSDVDHDDHDQEIVMESELWFTQSFESVVHEISTQDQKGCTHSVMAFI